MSVGLCGCLCVFSLTTNYGSKLPKTEMSESILAKASFSKRIIMVKFIPAIIFVN